MKVPKFNRARGRVTFIVVDKDGFSNIDSSSGARATGAQMANPAGKSIRRLEQAFSFRCPAA